VGWNVGERKPHKGANAPTAVFLTPRRLDSSRRSVNRVLSDGFSYTYNRLLPRMAKGVNLFFLNILS